MDRDITYHDEEKFVIQYTHTLKLDMTYVLSYSCKQHIRAFHHMLHFAEHFVNEHQMGTNERESREHIGDHKLCVCRYIPIGMHNQAIGIR